MRSVPNSSSLLLVASATPSVYTKIFAPGSRSMVYSLYRTPSMAPTATPCLSLNSAKLSPAFFRAGYSCPALAAVSLPVEISSTASHTVTNISSGLREQICWFTRVRILAGLVSFMAA